jgi:hypothetical protein
MEQNNPDSLFELQVDHESRNHFKETTKWTNFIAIIYFICFGLLILGFMLAGSMLLNYGSSYSGADGAEFRTTTAANATLQMILGIVMIAFFIYGGIMLLRFSSACRRGVETQDQMSFNFGLKALRNYFIAMGCVAVLGILDDVYTIINSI